jgi:hypothetical protein
MHVAVVNGPTSLAPARAEVVQLRLPSVKTESATLSPRATTHAINEALLIRQSCYLSFIIQHTLVNLTVAAFALGNTT